MKSLSESQIQQQIISLLSMLAGRHNFVFFSVPNEGIMSVLMSFRVNKIDCYKIVSHFKKMGLLPGVSDLMILHEGRAYCMEVKLPKYSDGERYPEHGQSKDQIRFEGNVNKTGIPYEIVYDMNDVLPVLKMWRVVR